MKLANQRHQELETYDTVHGQAQSDIQRFLQAHQEHAMEIETTLEQEEEISVEAEREVTRANIARMQDISASQEAGYKQMMANIRENDLEHVARAIAGAADAKRGGVAFPVEEMQLFNKSRCNSERLLNACTVANELGQRSKRQDRFQRRRRSCINDEVEKMEALERKHEEADKRAASRQKELVEKQAVKTSAAQQKRGENQKILKEIQKFQEQQFEKLQLKHHPEAVSTSKGSNHHPAVSSTAPPSRPSSSAALDAEEEPRSPTAEPVHRLQVQSHKLYKKTLDKWSVFVTDNKRRTEAYWLKMLDGQPHDRDKKVASRMNALRKTVQGRCTVHKFLTGSHGSSDDLEISDHKDEQYLPMSPVRMNSARTTEAPPTSPTYEDRLEHVRSHQANLRQQAMEKRERDTAILENKQKKSREEMRLKAERAKNHNADLAKKTALSSKYRETMAVKSDAENMEKLARQKMERREKEAIKNEELDALKCFRMTHSLNVKANKKRHLESWKDTLQEKQIAKQERLAENLAMAKEADDSPKAQDYDEVLKGKLAIKSASEQAFSASTAKSLEMKLQRADKMKLQVLKPKSPMEALERQRALRKEKGGHALRAPPPELTLTPGWDAKLEDLGLADIYASSMQKLRSSAPSLSIHKIQSPSNGGMSKLSSPGGDGSKCTSGRSNRSSANSSEDDHEAEFISDLQCRSAKWLEDLRQREEL